MASRLISNLLGYLGVIPFAAGAWLVLSEAELFGMDARFLFISYSSIILSFLGGVLWGRGLGPGTAPENRNILLVISNGLALLGWFSLLATVSGGFSGLLSDSLIVVGLLLGYLLACLVEYRLAGAPGAGFAGFYLPMRGVLTAMVVAIHLLVVLLA